MKVLVWFAGVSVGFPADFFKLEEIVSSVRRLKHSGFDFLGV